MQSYEISHANGDSTEISMKFRTSRERHQNPLGFLQRTFLRDLYSLVPMAMQAWKGELRGTQP